MSRRALITGASAGLGREFALQLAAVGIETVLTSRSKDTLEALKAEIENAYNVGAEVIPVDLSLPGSARSLYEECEKRNLIIDILINNAGAGIFGESVSLESEKIERLVFLNIASLTNLSNIFAAKMIERGSGHILNVGSLAGNQATPFFASYSASKRYVHDFTMALRRELVSSGVTVTCLVPGFVNTAFDANAGISHPRYLAFSRRGALSAAKVARIGIRGMFKGKAKVTAGVSNKVIAGLAAIVPARIKTAAIHYGVGWIIR